MFLTICVVIFCSIIVGVLFAYRDVKRQELGYREHIYFLRNSDKVVTKDPILEKKDREKYVTIDIQN
jgi:hypothetical protein